MKTLLLLAMALAQAQTLEIPVRPGSEDVIQSLALPCTLDGGVLPGTSWSLQNINIEATMLRFTLGTEEDPERVIAVLDLEPILQGKTATVQATGARPAAAAFKNILERNLTGVALSAAGSIPKEHDLEEDGDDGPPPLFTVWNLCLLTCLLLALALALALDIRRHRISAAALLALLLLTLAAGLTVALLDDALVHPGSHGLNTLRQVAGHDSPLYSNPEPYGTLSQASAKLMGASAPSGGETFLASRVALVLLIPALFLLALRLLRDQWAALAAAGLFLAHPAVLYVGRAETPVAPRLLVLVLAAWFCAAAARRRSLLLLMAAAIGLAALGNMRLMGPVLAPVTASLLLLEPDEPDARRGWSWWLPAGLAVLLAAAAALPHGLSMLELAGADVGNQSSGRGLASILTDNLLTNRLWTPPAFALMVAGGVGLLLWRNRRLGLILATWILLAVVAPGGSAFCYQDQARFQIFLLPAAATAAAWLIVWLVGAIRCRTVGTGAGPLQAFIAPAAASVVLAGLAWGLVLPIQVQSYGTIDTRQLHLWRRALAELPEGASLVLPARISEPNRSSLPDTEVMSLRTDVQLISLERWMATEVDTPAFWFQPFWCALEPPEGARTTSPDCEEAARLLEMEPVLIMEHSNRLPPALAEAAGETGRHWSFYSMAEDPVQVGLYRVRRR